MSNIKIDLENLVIAMDDHSYSLDWYLDKETGDIFPVANESGEIDMDEEIIDKIEKNPDRYQVVDPIESHESFKIMEGFVDALPESKAREVLWRALSRRKPFRSFNDALLAFEDIRNQWFEYREAAILEKAEEWLGWQEIDAEIVRRPKQPGLK